MEAGEDGGPGPRRSWKEGRVSEALSARLRAGKARPAGAEGLRRPVPQAGVRGWQEPALTALGSGGAAQQGDGPVGSRGVSSAVRELVHAGAVPWRARRAVGEPSKWGMWPVAAQMEDSAGMAGELLSCPLQRSQNWVLGKGRGVPRKGTVLGDSVTCNLASPWRQLLALSLAGEVQTDLLLAAGGRSLVRG